MERSKRSAKSLDTLAQKFPSKAARLDPEVLAKIQKNLAYTTEKVPGLRNFRE